MSSPFLFFLTAESEHFYFNCFCDNFRSHNASITSVFYIIRKASAFPCLYCLIISLDTYPVVSTLHLFPLLCKKVYLQLQFEYQFAKHANQYSHSRIHC